VQAAAPAATSVQAPAAGAPATAQAPPARVAVRMSRSQGLGNVIQVPLLKGYFEEQGIQLDQVEFRTSSEAIPPLARGELDAGAQAPNAGFFNALTRDVRLALALDASYADPRTRPFPLMSRLAGGAPVVQEVADLRGKRLAHNQRGIISEPALERMLGEVGMTVGDLQDVQFMPFPDVLAAFGGGTIDASIMPEPFATTAEERGLGARVRESSDYILGAQIAMVAFSEQFARDRADAGRRFAVAYLRGVRDYMDAMEHGRDRETIVGIIAESAGVPPPIIDKAGYFPIRRDGRVNAETLASFADWLREHGYIQHRPDVPAMVSYQFADHAARTLDGGR
jgi:NitT/TauT family transport system substrate-binding protein